MNRPAKPKVVKATQSPSPEPVSTSFSTLVSEMTNPTTTMGRLNRTREWQEGYEASRRGMVKSRNPYDFNTVEHDEWALGWETKFYGETV
jgi:hypothetical protein